MKAIIEKDGDKVNHKDITNPSQRCDIKGFNGKSP
jgi:hypothetical protein